MPRILQGPLKRALIVENPHESIDQMLIDAGFEVERLDFSPNAEQLGDIRWMKNCCMRSFPSNQRMTRKQSHLPVLWA
jgi:hypothetical protein